MLNIKIDEEVHSRAHKNRFHMHYNIMIEETVCQMTSLRHAPLTIIRAIKPILHHESIFHSKETFHSGLFHSLCLCCVAFH